jgi:protein-disulfide isomerase/uncharacterized membrane protein
MNQRVRAWLLACGWLGLAASAASLYVHYRMGQDPSYTSFCSISQTINCGAAYLSSFGSVLGVPIALGGVIWFTLALLVTSGLDSASAREGTAAPAYLFVLAAPALGVVLFYAYVSVVMLKVVCILCEITSVAVAGIFLISGAAAGTPLSALPRRALGDLRRLVARPMAVTVLMLFIAGAASAVAFFPKTPGEAEAAPPVALSNQQATSFEEWFAGQPRVPIVLPTDGARVLIVKFTDYQCPSCGETYGTDRPVLAKYQAEQPGAVKLIVKDYPLEPECNPNIPTTMHEAACEAAAAVRMAQRHQRGPAMEEWLYTHQPNLTPAAVRVAAREVGGVADFDAEYPRVLTDIRNDVELARRLGIKGTPTYFINGVRVDGGLRPQYLDAAIAHELRATSAAKP